MVNVPPSPVLEKSTQKIGGEFTQKQSNEIGDDESLFAITNELLPRYGIHWNAHNLVTLKRQSLSRLIYCYELYKKIVDIPGVICEFGVQWGATLATMMNLRGMLEPYNHSRKIFGFDTFEGFPGIDQRDGDHHTRGDYATIEGYEKTLEKLLNIHEHFSPLSHLKKFELVKGDASETFPKWLRDNPHVVVSMALFDMDLYKPTADVLRQIIPRLTKGSLLVFDELNCPHFPGETAAVEEVLGLNKISLKHFPHQAFCSWAVFGE